MRNDQNISGSGISSFLSYFVLAVSLLSNNLLERRRLNNFCNYFLENTSDWKLNISRCVLLSCIFYACVKVGQFWKEVQYIKSNEKLQENGTNLKKIHNYYASRYYNI